MALDLAAAFSKDEYCITRRQKTFEMTHFLNKPQLSFYASNEALFQRIVIMSI